MIDNVVNEIEFDFKGLLITDIKLHELNMEFDVSAPLGGLNIPDQRYRSILTYIIKCCK